MKKIALFALACLTNSLQAQEAPKTYSFSLEQAISHALTNNYSAMNADRDIAMARKKKWETTAMGLPQISAGLDYQNNFELQKSLIPAEFFGGQPGEFAEIAFGTKHNMNARSNWSQIIFDGSYLVALQASKTYLKFYENAKKNTAVSVREMVINTYGNVLLAEEGLLILKKNKTTLEKTLFETNEIFKNGLIEEENVEQLQITLATVNSSLVYTERLLEIARKMLKITLGMELTDNLTLTDKLDQLSIANLDLTFAKSEFKIDNNTNYQIAKNFTEQRQLELKLEKSKALPSLYANVNFGYNAFNNEFAFFTQNQRWMNYSNLGMSLQVPIFSSLMRSARTQQARIAVEKANTQLKETTQKLQLQFEKAKSEYEFSVEEFTTAKTNLLLAERIEKKQEIKFTEGLSSSFEFNEAQRQLYTAQQNYLQSMVNIINKKAALSAVLNN
jgi:outer membrane protein TolC